jgi:hypothetical protein
MTLPEVPGGCQNYQGVSAWRETKLAVRRRLAAWFIDDRQYVAALYRKAFGRAPDLDQPRGFNEKILVKIIRDRRAFLTLFSDKLRVREYVRRVAPSLALPQVYWWTESADSIPFELLPPAFVLKANHGSGWVRVIEDQARVPHAELVRLARQWLATDFTLVGREWAYRDVRRAVYAEELLRGPDGRSPPDYKLFVFGGKVRMIQVDRDRFAHHTQALHDEAWRVIEGTVKGAHGAPAPRPHSLPAMIEAAEALSMGIDFLRVDLYEIGDTPYFGELTHYPNKGLSRFAPADLDLRLGSYLRLDGPADVPPALTALLADGLPPESVADQVVAISPRP